MVSCFYANGRAANALSALPYAVTLAKWELGVEQHTRHLSTMLWGWAAQLIYRYFAGSTNLTKQEVVSLWELFSNVSLAETPAFAKPL